MKNNVYGCDIESFIDSVVESIAYQTCGANTIVAGLMSDAQEQIAFGNAEGARQTLNRAKLLLFKVIVGELAGQRGR